MRVGPLRAHAKRPSRTALLALVVSVGITATAVAVTGALVAAPMRGKMARFPSPLHVYPVTQATPGECLSGARGVNGESASGPTCYQVATGIQIHRVNDIHVQGGRLGGGNEISISLLPADRRAFAALTRRMVGRDVAFVVRGRLITATRVETPITRGKVLIAGGFTRPDADRLIHELKGLR
jgi:hypothetical protein